MFAVIASMALRGETQEDVEDTIREAMFIQERGGRPAKVVFLFPWQREGVIEEVRLVGSVPVVQRDGEIVDLQCPQWLVTVLLVGSAANKAAYGRYINSRTWFVPGVVEALATSAPFPYTSLDQTKFGTIL